jgi:hypothetical protein
LLLSAAKSVSETCGWAVQQKPEFNPTRPTDILAELGLSYPLQLPPTRALRDIE